MRKKNYPIFLVVVTLVIILMGGTLFFGRYMISEAKKQEQEEQKAEELVINIPEPSTQGKMTIFEPDGTIYFQYVGDFIKIKNDGSNGEDIELEINLPVSSGCSCFPSMEEGETDVSE